MSRVLKIVILLLVIAVPVAIWLRSARNPQQVESRNLPSVLPLLAAPGRVEGRGQTISIGAGMDGIVKQVLVTEGQQVSEGALLSKIDCKDISAEIDLSNAQVESARQAKNLLMRGHRDEEREAAARQADAAKAVLQQAQDHASRIETLFQKNEVSRDEYEQNKRDVEVAQANYDKALDEQRLANAAPLPEEVSRADAEIAAAERNVNVVTERLEKCNVRAPISGTILKVMTKPGESYSTLLPRPLFTMADDSVRRVRAEVDERDIGKIKLGQETVVTADAFPGQRFEGQVIQISHAMEPNSVLTEDPAQKNDHDVLDVLIELKRSQNELPLGLRVTAQMTNTVTALADSSAPLSTSPNVANTVVADARAKVPAAAPAQSTEKRDGFVLQVGAMTRKENADHLVDALMGQNFPAFVLTHDRFYRVDVGPYPDLAAARIAKDKLKQGGFETVLEQLLSDSEN